LHGVWVLLLHRLQHRLNAWYPLLMHGVAWVCGIMSIGNCGHVVQVHMMILLFFFEVRNAYSTIIMVVVGTILELLLRRPVGLSKVL